MASRLPGDATEAFWLAVRGNLDLLSEARDWWRIVGDDIVPPAQPEEANFLRAAARAPADGALGCHDGDGLDEGAWCRDGTPRARPCSTRCGWR